MVGSIVLVKKIIAYQFCLNGYTYHDLKICGGILTALTPRLSVIIHNIVVMVNIVFVTVHVINIAQL